MADKSEIVCVLGMHRSGTSLVTRVLNLLGLYLGPEEKMLAASESNVKGFWEHKEFLQLNDDILARFGGRWDEPPMLSPGWESSPQIEDLRQRACSLIEENFAGKYLWGWKDPRNCLTLPFWRLLLPRMRFVICLRNPVDVARSLKNREGFTLEKGIDLWLTYMNSALQSMAGQQRLRVFYENFMSDWPGELRRLAAFLSMPEQAARADVVSQVQDFIEKDLQHYRTPIDETLEESAVEFPAKALYLVERVRDGSGKWPDYNDEGIEKAVEIFSRRSVESRNESKTLREQLAGLKQALAESENRFQLLESQSEAQRREADVLRADHQAQNERFLKRLREKDEALQMLTAEHEQTARSLPVEPHQVRVDIIICAHGSIAIVKRCLRALVQCTTMPYSFILVDDGSDEETRQHLVDFALDQGAMLLCNGAAAGFASSADKGLRQSNADYAVILSSDVEVTDGWLDRMVACAMSDGRIGLVGPISNYDLQQRNPLVFRGDEFIVNRLPEGASSADIAKTLGETSRRLYPRLPFINGFCLMIKRKVISEVGYFDASCFGEWLMGEMDYRLRAARAGWQIALADDVYVHHGPT